MTEQSLPTSPEITPETEVYWDAANNGQLLLKRCIGTDKAFHPPRTFSPFTGTAETEWFQASGAGQVYSFSVTKRHGAEHCIAYIELAEGPIVLSALTDCDFDKVKIGQTVRVVFAPSTNGQLVPMFAPDTGN